MKINVASKKPSKFDVFSTISNLNNVLRVFGLSCVYRDNTSIKYYSPIWILLFYTVFFFVGNVYSIIVKLENNDDKIQPNFKDTIQNSYLLGYIQYITDAIFIYKYGRQDFVDYIMLYDYIDSILGGPYKEKIKKSLRKMCAFFFAVAILSIITDYITWADNTNLYFVFVYIIEYMYLTIRMIGALDIIANCILVKYRLKVIGDWLENYYNYTDNKPGATKDFIYDGAWINTDDPKTKNHLDTLKTVEYDRLSTILCLSRCYSLLTEQCDFINVKYGSRVLLGCLIYLLDMVLMFNLVIRILMGTLVLVKVTWYFLVASTLVRIISYTVILLCAVIRCEENYRETERITRYVDHILVTKKITNEVRDTLRELKDLIFSKPINYHAHNFYRFDYSTLVSMASVMVTYTIILLQSLK